jgi:hypothetical protein
MTEHLRQNAKSGSAPTLLPTDVSTISIAKAIIPQSSNRWQLQILAPDVRKTKGPIEKCSDPSDADRSETGPRRDFPEKTGHIISDYDNK